MSIGITEVRSADKPRLICHDVFLCAQFPMNAAWQTFITSNGARLDAGHMTVTAFGDTSCELQTAETGSALADLSHYGYIHVHGEEATTFLQGQFSNDIREVSATHWQLSSYNTAKGRMLAILNVLHWQGGYLLILPKLLVAPTLKRLRMFVLRAKVGLEDVSDALTGLGLSGAGSELAVQEWAGTTLPSVGDATEHDGAVAMRLTGHVPRYRIVAPTDIAIMLWKRFTRQAQPVGEPAWRLTEVLAGEPVIQPETVEAFVPQMANLEILQGISFTKGCYPGQEIVARTHYLGTQKRRMYALRIATADVPTAGTDIYVSGDDTQPVGKLVSAALRPDGDTAALAVLQIERSTQELRLGNGSGPIVTLGELPYSLGAQTA